MYYFPFWCQNSGNGNLQSTSIVNSSCKGVVCWPLYQSMIPLSLVLGQPLRSERSNEEDIEPSDQDNDLESEINVDSGNVDVDGIEHEDDITTIHADDLDETTAVTICESQIDHMSVEVM